MSGGVSLGGGIAIAMVKDITLASLNGQTTAGRNITVMATDDQPDASIMRTYAGGGGVAPRDAGHLSDEAGSDPGRRRVVGRAARGHAAQDPQGLA